MLGHYKPFQAQTISGNVFPLASITFVAIISVNEVAYKHLSLQAHTKSLSVLYCMIILMAKTATS